MAGPASRLFGAARVALILATVCVIWAGLVSSDSTQQHGSTQHGSTQHGSTTVRSGQPIQAAIDAAHRGDRIVVEAGTYAEQLTIKKDGISLVGLGAILVPPNAPTQNLCSGLAGNGTEAGICVMGSGVDLAPFVSEHRKVLSVGQRVKDVSITGFQVRGFSGENIAVVGAQDARVTANNLTDGEQYGCLSAGSENTQIAGNTVTASPEKLWFIGICMDDVASVKVSSNHISGYTTGLCVQTSGADVEYNDVSDSCTGVFVDPRIDGAKICNNHISATNPICATFGIPVGGIVVDGSVNTVVKQNLIEGQTVGGLPGQSGVGVVVVDEPTVEPVAVASGNKIIYNVLRNNDLDLFVNTTGTHNVIKRNICSTPANLCSKE